MRTTNVAKKVGWEANVMSLKHETKMEKHNLCKGYQLNRRKLICYKNIDIKKWGGTIIRIERNNEMHKGVMCTVWVLKIKLVYLLQSSNFIIIPFNILPSPSYIPLFTNYPLLEIIL